MVSYIASPQMGTGQIPMQYAQYATNGAFGTVVQGQVPAQTMMSPYIVSPTMSQRDIGYEEQLINAPGLFTPASFYMASPIMNGASPFTSPQLMNYTPTMGYGSAPGNGYVDGVFQLKMYNPVGNQQQQQQKASRGMQMQKLKGNYKKSPTATSKRSPTAAMAMMAAAGGGGGGGSGGNSSAGTATPVGAAQSTPSTGNSRMSTFSADSSEAMSPTHTGVAAAKAAIASSDEFDSSAGFSAHTDAGTSSGCGAVADPSQHHHQNSHHPGAGGGEGSFFGSPPVDGSPLELESSISAGGGSGSGSFDASGASRPAGVYDRDSAHSELDDVAQATAAVADLHVAPKVAQTAGTSVPLRAKILKQSKQLIAK
jgi:hypothetical protein